MTNLRSVRLHRGRWWLIAVACLGVILVAGCGGGDQQTATSGTPGGPMAPSRSEDDSTENDGAQMSPGIQMTTGPGMMPGGGGMPPMAGGMGGMGSFGPMGAAGPTGGTQAASQAAGPQVTTRPPGARPDPFRPWWSTTPPPPPAITLVEPYRIATRESMVRPPEEKIEVQEVPNRRVAGIATGLGVYALIEGPEGQSVVRPGDMLGEYRVEAIRARSVILKRKVGNVTYTQEVPLTDVGSQLRTPFVGGMRGGPGGAGMMFRGGAGGFAPPAGGGGTGGPIGAESEI